MKQLLFKLTPEGLYAEKYEKANNIKYDNNLIE